LLVKYIFHQEVFSDLFCLVYLCIVLIKTTAATSRDHPLQTMSVPQSAYPHVRMPGARALVNQRVAIATLVTDPYKGSESSS
jgi:hypothetical protein